MQEKLHNFCTPLLRCCHERSAAAIGGRVGVCAGVRQQEARHCNRAVRRSRAQGREVTRMRESRSSSCTMSTRPLLAGVVSAVYPRSLDALTSVLLSAISTCTSFACPLLTAPASGVRPREFPLLGCMPGCCSSRATTSTCPLAAAEQWQ
jgi:hypothetical protein